MDYSFQALLQFLFGWPLLLYVVLSGIIYSIALRFVQIRKFCTSFSCVLAPQDKAKGGDVSPFQAFLNTVNANIGNGSVAGMGVAIYAGGPGAVFWIVVFGMLLAAVRYAEVFISTAVAEKKGKADVLGGPMLYLLELPAGQILSYLYALLCFPYALCGGSSIQANSIQVSLARTMNASPYLVAAILFVFVLYISLGGAKRISAASAILVPLKVGLFLFSAIGVLLYNIASIPHALAVIFQSAFSVPAFTTGLSTFTFFQAMRTGMSGIVFATEAGLGTAAVMFGYTGNSNARDNAYLGMLSVFCTTFICFLVGFCIVLSGVFDIGVTSTALTIAAYETVFGSCAGYIISVLSILFGIGVIVSFAYVSVATWNAVTGNRFSVLVPFIYSASAAAGVFIDVHMIWFLADVINAGLLLINIAGLIYLLPRYRHKMLA